MGGMNGGKFEFLRVRRRFRQPLTTGAGTIDAVDRVLLRTEDETGVGFGEAAPWPGFPTESCDEIAEVLRSARGGLSHLRAAVDAQMLSSFMRRVKGGFLGEGANQLMQGWRSASGGRRRSPPERDRQQPV